MPIAQHLDMGGCVIFANKLNSGECDLSDGSVEGDWRLPNVRELQSLIDYGLKPALPSGHPFTRTYPFYYWTSTTVAGDTSYVWHVALVTGQVNYEDKAR